MRLGQPAFVEGALAAGVQQHGEQVDALAVAFVVRRGDRQIAGQLHVALGADPLKAGQLAVAGLQLGHESVGHHLGDVFVRGILHFEQRQAVVLRDALELHALHDVHEGDHRSGSAGAAGAARAVDVAFVVFRWLV